jgi:hypothetical protein
MPETQIHDPIRVDVLSNGYTAFADCSCGLHFIARVNRLGHTGREEVEKLAVELREAHFKEPLARVRQSVTLDA